MCSSGHIYLHPPTCAHLHSLELAAACAAGHCHHACVALGMLCTSVLTPSQALLPQASLPQVAVAGLLNHYRRTIAGSFTNGEEAALLYDAAARELRGPDCPTNFPEPPESLRLK